MKVIVLDVPLMFTPELGGRLDLGSAGMSVFGLAWGWWRPALIAVTLLTVLDYGPAKAGIIVILVILALLVLLPRLGDAA